MPHWSLAANPKSLGLTVPRNRRFSKLYHPLSGRFTKAWNQIEHKEDVTHVAHVDKRSGQDISLKYPGKTATTGLSEMVARAKLLVPIVLEWRNWQTQQTQNLPPVTRRGGSTPPSSIWAPRNGLVHGRNLENP